MMLVRKNKYVGHQQKKPTKELSLFWPHECPDNQVGMDKPPQKLGFQLLEDTKTMMLFRKKQLWNPTKKPKEGTDVVLATSMNALIVR